jgi:DNA-binding MarR family transcriptional regulator
MVSERYYPPMAAPSNVSARTVAELVVQLGCLSRGDGFVADLTLAQWTALRYFSRANRFSRTVSAFAEFHGTTRGTASQTIKSLVQNDYLTRKRSKIHFVSIAVTRS